MNILVKIVVTGILSAQLACSNKQNVMPIFYGPDQLNVMEGQLLNVQLNAFDPEKKPLIFVISGGDDSQHFQLTPSGILSFITPPDFESPADADADNQYEIDVVVTDGINETARSFSITVKDDPTEIVIGGEAGLLGGFSFEEGAVLGVDITGILEQEGIDPSSVEYQWYSIADDGSTIPLSDTDQYVLTQADVNQKLKLQVSYLDENGDPVIVESPETEIIRNVNENVDLANLAEGVGFEISAMNLSRTARAGWSTSIAGDMNGDGLADLVVGAPASLYGDDKGASYVVYGSLNSSDVTLTVDGVSDGNDSRGFVIQGATLRDFFGQSVSNAGDVNADGYADLIIAAHYASDKAGASYVVYGSSGGGNLELSELNENYESGFAIQGAGPGHESGFAVGSAGDVNADGYADLIVGAPYASDKAGASYVVYGSSGGGNLELSELNETYERGFVVDGPAANQKLGRYVASAGDINNDGFDDVHISGNDEPAKTYTVIGAEALSPIDLNTSNSNVFNVSGFDQEDKAAFNTKSAGDVNGDGNIDMIMSARSVRGKGVTFVVFGPWDPADGDVSLKTESRDTWSGFIIEGNSEDGEVGFGAGSAGDINGDGYDDLIISAPTKTVGELSEAGVNYIVYGNVDAKLDDLTLDDMVVDDGFVITGAEAYHQSGGKLSKGTGDVNGDGFDDVIIGALDITDSVSNYRLENEDTFVCSVCASYVIYGGPTDYDALDKTLTRTDEKSLVGSHGKDNLTWLEAGAVLIGGAGNDNLIIGDEDFLRIDGGNGVDRLTLASDSSINLDFTAENNDWHKNAITGIEEIDMTEDSATNRITLSAVDVFNLSNTSNTLKVYASSNDTVVLKNLINFANWESDIAHATYSSNNAVVEVIGLDDVLIQ